MYSNIHWVTGARLTTRKQGMCQLQSFEDAEMQDRWWNNSLASWRGRDVAHYITSLPSRNVVEMTEYTRGTIGRIWHAPQTGEVFLHPHNQEDAEETSRVSNC